MNRYPLLCLSSILLIATAVRGQDIFPQEHTYGQPVILIMEEPVVVLDQLLLKSILDRTSLEQTATTVLGADYPVEDLHLKVQVQVGKKEGSQRRAYVWLSYVGELKKAELHAIWRALVDDFSKRLSVGVARIEQHRISLRANRIEKLRKKAAEAEKLVESNLRAIREIEKGQSPLSPDQLRKQIQQLSQRINEFKMKRIGWEARREATVKEIERMRAQAEQKSQEAPVLKELARLVQLKEEQLALIMQAHNAGNVTSSVVAEAQAEVAEAKIKLLEHGQKQVDPGLSSQISTLNVRLADGMIEMVESRKVLEELQKQLERDTEQLAEKTHGNTHNEVAQIRLKLAKARLSQILREIDNLEAESPEPASVKVIPWVE